MPRIKPAPGRTAAAVPVESDIEQADVPFQSDDTEVTEPEVKVTEEDASTAFQKQIEALRRSEKAQKDRAEQLIRDRDVALQQARERDEQINQLRQQNVESQTEAVASALAAAQAAADGAERDIAAAIEAGDTMAQAKAYRRLSKAEADIARLEDGKEAMEAQVKAPPPQEQRVNEQPRAPQLPPLAVQWLQNHPDYMKDSRKNAEVQHFHYKVVDEGHEAYSPEYFESLETHLGLRTADESEPEPVVQKQKVTTPMVSAPVSRDVPSSSHRPTKPGEVKLSAAQKEAAKASGITETEYAKQVLRLQNEKMNGNYSGGQ